MLGFGFGLKPVWMTGEAGEPKRVRLAGEIQELERFRLRAMNSTGYICIIIMRSRKDKGNRLMGQKSEQK